MTNFSEVINFNKSFGIPISDTELIDILNNDKKLVEYRFSLIKEEVNELNDAFNDENFIEVIDALSDILYVVYGAGASFGINLDILFKDHSQNILNSNFNADVTNYDQVLNILNAALPIEIPNKPINIFKEVLDEKLLNLLDLEIDKLNKITKNLYECNDFEVLKRYLVKLLYFTYNIGCILGIDLNKTFSIVHYSNMSKLCVSINEAIETVEWYKNNDSRYDSPDFRKSEDGLKWVVFNKSTKKILKSINYKPANFESYLL